MQDELNEPRGGTKLEDFNTVHMWGSRIIPKLESISANNANRRAAGDSMVYQGSFEEPELVDDGENVALDFIRFIGTDGMILGIRTLGEGHTYHEIMEYVVADGSIRISRYEEQAYRSIMNGSLDYSLVVDNATILRIYKHWNDLYVALATNASPEEIEEVCGDASEFYEIAISTFSNTVSSPASQSNVAVKEEIRQDEHGAKILAFAREFEALVREQRRHARIHDFRAPGVVLTGDPSIGSADVTVDRFSFRIVGEKISAFISFTDPRGRKRIHFSKTESGISVVFGFYIPGKNELRSIEYEYLMVPEAAATVLVNKVIYPKAEERGIESILDEWFGNYELALERAPRLIPR